MNRHLTFLTSSLIGIITLFSFSAFGQDFDEYSYENTKKWYFSADVMREIKYVRFEGTDETRFDFDSGTRLGFGYYLLPQLSIGINSGLEFSNQVIAIPALIEARLFLNDKDVSPFLIAQGGYQFVRGYYRFLGTARGQNEMASLGFGVKMPVRRMKLMPMMQINLANVNVEYQNAENFRGQSTGLSIGVRIEY
jgi:hypothetical protein